MRNALLLLLASVLAAPAGAVVFENAGFDTNVLPWSDTIQGTVTAVDWNALDATGDPGSGSLRLVSSSFFGGPMSECFPAAALTDYEVHGKVYVPTQAAVPVASVVLVFYDEADCTDARQIIQEDSFPPVADEWTEVGGPTTSFSSVHSMRIWLFFDNAIQPNESVAYFDDITLTTAPEPGAIGAALVAVGALLATARTSSRAPGPSSRAARRATPSPCTASRSRRPASCRRA